MGLNLDIMMAWERQSRCCELSWFIVLDLDLPNQGWKPPGHKSWCSNCRDGRQPTAQQWDWAYRR